MSTYMYTAQISGYSDLRPRAVSGVRSNTQKPRKKDASLLVNEQELSSKITSKMSNILVDHFKLKINAFVNSLILL